MNHTEICRFLENEIEKAKDGAVCIPATVAKEILPYLQMSEVRNIWIQPLEDNDREAKEAMPPDKLTEVNYVWLQDRERGITLVRIRKPGDVQEQGVNAMLVDHWQRWLPMRTYGVEWRCWQEMPTVREAMEGWRESL